MSKKVLIIGGGPAGLTAALELIRHTDYIPVVIEQDSQVGGISKTVNYKGNRMDIGGHRFFSKSDWVMNWWLDILPISTDQQGDHQITYRKKTRNVSSSSVNADNGQVMLLRPRLSRIYFLRKFFDYPLKLNVKTIVNLGFVRLLKASYSYLAIRLFPIKEEKTLRDFIINRFGNELYKTFFKDYTEKVWGVPCEQISSEWGAQRIKGVSITAILLHALKAPFNKLFGASASSNTSLIEQFLYPRLGPGQMWEVVADKVAEGGGSVILNSTVTALEVNNQQITGATIKEQNGDQQQHNDFAYVISTMPFRELINGITSSVPEPVKQVANGLIYRDFITVGVLLSGFKQSKYTLNNPQNMLPDNWIYIQESDVKVGRLQIFNNWSEHLVDNKDQVWVGMEYFCSEGDELWQMSEDQLKQLAALELAKIGLIDNSNVLDTHVLKVPKAYPAYFGAYDQFSVIRDYVDSINNLFLVGRNGMHRYNNQDHSMLTAKLAVEGIASGVDNRQQIWDVNIDDEYHEEASSS